MPLSSMSSCLPPSPRAAENDWRPQQLCCPCCLWGPQGTSVKVLGATGYSSPQSLLMLTPYQVGRELRDGLAQPPWQKQGLSPLSLTQTFLPPQAATIAHHSHCFHPAAEIPGSAGPAWQLLSFKRFSCEFMGAQKQAGLARRVCRLRSVCHI